ncbi:helix-turn-helix domain-containing protein [Porphyromonas gingivalis]|uniref:helix-turn-helix domain-containing protein n=1 Tax=Porphyromonas gingivalis TaxID=837 RepID=UPI00097D8712|nr:helix-turn-helix domain-containing protein [Porphyromonas gingivalis]
MDNDVKTKNNEEIAHFLNASDRMIKGIDVLRKKNRPLINGHRYLTDDELSRLLHINRRTLQDYRNMGRISFVKLGGKVLYREEDVEKLLQENYRPRFEKP